MNTKSKLQQTVTCLATVLTAAWMTASALASPPYVNYQGTINDASGVPINSSQALTFNIYNEATGGAQVWGPFNVTTPIVNGRFNVILGPTDSSGRSIDQVFGSSNDRYLAVTVGGTAISPRQRFLANPYAYSASSVANPRYEITPDRFSVLTNNLIEFGGGIPNKHAGNGSVSYTNDSLAIVGGGTNKASRLTSIDGNLFVRTNEGGVGPNFSVQGNAEIGGTLKAPVIMDASGRAINLADLVAATYPLPQHYANTNNSNVKDAVGITIDLSAFLANDYRCRIDFHLYHKTSGDLQRATELYMAIENTNGVSRNVTPGIQGSLHGFILDSYQDFTLDTASQQHLGTISSGWVAMYNYKMPTIDWGPVTQEVWENNAKITAKTPAFTNQDKHKIFVVFNAGVGGTITVRKY